MIGIGIDLVDVEEAARLLDRWGERLLSRVLTESERAYVLRSARPSAGEKGASSVPSIFD